MTTEDSPLGSRPIALVLPGGAALGSWQGGCLYALAQKGISFHSIFGTSIGALNGCGYFQDSMERMWKVWRDVRGSDFFRFRPGLNPVHIFSQRHLREYLSGHVDEERARRLKRCWFYVISTDIAHGKTHQAVYSPETDGPWHGNLLDHILGSISIPLLLPPVPVDGNGSGPLLLLDGNAKSYVNLLPAIERGARDIVFLSVVHPAELKRPAFGLRSYIGTLINQFLQGQIDHSLDAARLLAKDKGLRFFVFHPERPLTISPLSFKTAECRAAFDGGLADAERLLANPEAYRVI
ncbi:MAG: patatin-like phospholipase family protein [Elusimicrobia bacterium]|nr:patatin-like phospholipase family protein [Elusimicrobiota bacterium]